MHIYGPLYKETMYIVLFCADSKELVHFCGSLVSMTREKVYTWEKVYIMSKLH